MRNLYVLMNMWVAGIDSCLRFNYCFQPGKWDFVCSVVSVSSETLKVVHNVVIWKCVLISRPHLKCKKKAKPYSLFKNPLQKQCSLAAINVYGAERGL